MGLNGIIIRDWIIGRYVKAYYFFDEQSAESQCPLLGMTLSVLMRALPITGIMCGPDGKAGQ